MILSASRRTDLPAFYSEWFLHRLKQGYVLVRNPMSPSQVSRVVLSPETIDCIVFWTKNPAPMLDILEEIRQMGYEFYFQFTLNPYGNAIERYLPGRDARIEAFRRLSRAVGRSRVVWRYDPVILNDKLTPDWHMRSFRELCERIGGLTEECVFSFVDRYSKMSRRTAGLVREIRPEEMRRIASGFAETAQKNGIALKTCSEAIDLSSFGIEHASCIDRSRIERLAGCPIDGAKDPNQRPECGCLQSVDIGAYDTCRHGCVYCYACGGEETLRRKTRSHDPHSPLLAGHLSESDRVTERKAASLKKSQLTLL
ncbi:hypothetical protein CAFE_06230 [Caprobacter fermentans]|uniref:DUF1848 domain-containing protein n=1 Tax=Caproicibacter fermentans TaxID=2576756 RepID=A0A6N8HX31_9FIRM|nr:DUF1848 domain-containing protein [Caproicibacter fermentans]MVB09953.1 hypothetical protein [Caproicibacter fermentans]OCN00263.1 hypothetical protein A7X67_09355 [Clostridium sp. W14A]QNK42100.1 DUF1848 domain-containing protein [Caproicibacter fermentans]